MSFTITTTDSQYTYTALTNDGGEVIEQWNVKSNNKATDTQGFLRKVEKGAVRAEAVVSLTDTKTNLETNVMPMWTYPTNVNVTFNRNIPGKSSTTGVFVFEDYQIMKEFDNGDWIEVQIKLVEVIG